MNYASPPVPPLNSNFWIFGRKRVFFSKCPSIFQPFLSLSRNTQHLRRHILQHLIFTAENNFGKKVILQLRVKKICCQDKLQLFKSFLCEAMVSHREKSQKCIFASANASAALLLSTARKKQRRWSHASTACGLGCLLLLVFEQILQKRREHFSQSQATPLKSAWLYQQY